MTFETVQPPRSVWRIGRRPDPLEIRIPLDREELARPSAGNRFDSPLADYGVLYFGTTLKACFVETISRFRPDPEVVTAIKDEWAGRSDLIEIGGVPAEWRLERLAVRVSLQGSLPFLDLTSTETQQALRLELAEKLVRWGYEDLDLSVVCSKDRRVTREISYWANQRTNERVFLYGGIKYNSRLGAEHECWAVFGDATITELERKHIGPTDPDLRAVAKMYKLRVF